MTPRWTLPVVLLALALGGAAEGAAQSPADCERWRAAFTSMREERVTIDADGRRVPVTVKVAALPEEQAAGFQCAAPAEIQRTLILFDFDAEIQTAFHMRNVAAPLDIAFIKADGRIFAILRMAPSPTALYGPLGPFRWALEARAGFFTGQGIHQGAARLMAGAR
jgi:uncharacterized membrane protein (UPF0127 family)